MAKGLFITFEGIDGCGKTTQFRRLVELFEQKQVPYTATREPGGSPAGDRIRAILINSSDLRLEPKTELMLFLANRVQNLAEIVKPGIATGKIVLSDRHRDSSIAFQGGGRQLGVDWVDRAHAIVCDIVPDCTILFDLTVAASRARAAARDRGGSEAKQIDRFEREGIEFHERIWAAYQQLVKKYPDRFLVIDASGSIAEVTQLMVAGLARRYPDQFSSIF